MGELESWRLLWWGRLGIHYFAESYNLDVN